MPPPLQWKDFRRRLERTRAPTALPPVLEPAAGAQLTLAWREGPGDEGDRRVALEVTNLGLDNARLRVEVRDAGGKKVGRLLPRRHQQLAPGERREISVRPTQAQWNALQEGGCLVVSPGDLPEPWRSFRLRGGAAPASSALEWEVPVPHAGVFELPAQSGRVAEMGVSLDLQTSDRGDILLRGAPLNTRPKGASLALLLPCEEVRYRFRRGAETFRDPHNPAFAAPPDDDWSLHAPGFLRRTWTLPPVSAPVAGRLSTSPSGRLRVEPEWIEAAPGEEPEIRLELETGWLPRWRSDRETVSVHLADAEGQRQRDVLEVTLLRRRLAEPAVRLAGPPPEIDQMPLRWHRGRWCIELVLDNPGSQQAVVALRAGHTHRSAEVKVPPTPFPPPEELPTFFFDLSDEAAAAVRQAAAAGRPLQARLESRGRVFWDPATVAFRPELVLPGETGGRPISMPGDLRWEVGEPARGEDEPAPAAPDPSGWWETVRLILHHRGPRPVIVKEGTISKGGYPHRPLSPFVRVQPGETKTLFEERVRTGWRRPVVLRAVVTVAGESEADRTATVRLRRQHPPEIETDAGSQSPSQEVAAPPPPEAGRKALWVTLAAAALLAAALLLWLVGGPSSCGAAARTGRVLESNGPSSQLQKTSRTIYY